MVPAPSPPCCPTSSNDDPPPKQKTSTSRSSKKNKTSKKRKEPEEACEAASESGDEEEEPQQGKPEDYPMYYEKFYNNDLSKNGYNRLEATLEHLGRHGFDLQNLHKLDHLQIHQLIVNVHPKLAGKQYPQSYPTTNIAGHYTDRGSRYKAPKDIVELVYEALLAVKEHQHILNKSTFVGVRVKGVTKKHHREKPKTEGVGPTSAVLCDNENLSAFLEYVLCYHAFCKYSSTLPSHLRDKQMLEAIETGGRLVVLYFERFIYRGDNSVDSRTIKIHAQLRTGMNIEALLSLMHCSTELGERLLKTEAKGISSTAQQRGTETFERQTCSRIGDHLVLDKVGETLEQQYLEDEQATNATMTGDEPVEQEDHVARKEPHFKFSRQNRTVLALDRKGNCSDCDASSGSPPEAVVSHLMSNEPDMERFELYNEVVIRNGTRIRAWPNYRRSGPWYDYVDIQWDNGCHPGRALGFYKKKDGETGEQVIFAVVHVADEQSKNNIRGTIPAILTDHYKMKYGGPGSSSPRAPAIQSVPLASINTSILAYQHQPTPNLFDHRTPNIMTVRPRNEWAYIWLAWTEELKKANDKVLRHKPLQQSYTKGESTKNVLAPPKVDRTVAHLVPLKDRKLWQSVRENLQGKLDGSTTTLSDS
eukprot:scaffold2562_cov78-Cylindrotheca_fusiformis.AAC.2